MKLISISQLLPGMTIIEIGEQQGNIKLRRTETDCSAEFCQWLISVGVKSVYVTSDTLLSDQALPVSDNKQSPSTTQTLLHEAKQSVAPKASEYLSSAMYLSAGQSASSAVRVYFSYYQRWLGSLFVVFVVGLTIGFLPHQLPLLTEMSFFTADSINVDQTPRLGNNASDIRGKGIGDNVESVKNLEQTETQQVAKPTVSKTVSTVVSKKPLVVVDKIEERGIDTTTMSDVLTDSVEVSTSVVNVKQKPIESKEPVKVEQAISPDLLARFSDAIDAVDNEEQAEPTAVPADTLEGLPRIDQIPARLMTRVPNLEYNAHMYTSNRNDRWVNLNGLVVREGEAVEANLRLIEIAPQHIILSMEGTEFTLRALTDW